LSEFCEKEKLKRIKMIHVGDNTWNIRVLITDLQVEKTVRVKGDLHIGGVMLKLSKTEGESSLSAWQGIPLWFRNQSSAPPQRDKNFAP
jgi:Kindlin-2 N-terminal domain